MTTLLGDQNDIWVISHYFYWVGIF